MSAAGLTGRLGWAGGFGQGRRARVKLNERRRLTRRIAALAVVVTCGVSAVALGTSLAARSTTPTGAPRTDLPSAATSTPAVLRTYLPPAGKVYVGVSTTETGASYSDFLRATGLSRVAIWNLFTAPNQDFAGILRHVAAARLTAMLTWDFPGNGTLESIAAGHYDSYIRKVASEARAYGRPVFIRLDWEFNGHWYPWSAQTSDGQPRPGNSPADYVAAWRRTVDLFRSAPNVTFVWCPTMYQVVHPRPFPLSSWYPGNAYVGWIGVDAYLGSASWSYMQHGAAALDAEYSFAQAHHKPVMIAEWALSQPGTGDSPSLVSQFWSWTKAHPLVRAELWFNFHQEPSGTNYEITSFPRSAQLLRADLHGPGVEAVGP